MTAIFTKLGEKFYIFLIHLSRITQLLLSAMRISFTSPPRWRHISYQMFHIGVLSLPVILLTGAFTGMVLAIQAYYQFRQLQMETAIGALVGLSMTNELGPVLTSIMVAARVGAAMTAELGTMKVTEQIDALKAMATNPIRYLVSPRLIAGMIMIPVLTVFSMGIGVIGGYLVAVELKGVNATFFWTNMLFYTNEGDIITGLIKSFVFAIIIVIVSCYKGLSTEGGAEGVGRATMSTVVIACISILISDFFLSIILF